MSTIEAPQITPERAADIAELKKALAQAEGGRRWLVRLAFVLVLAGIGAGYWRWRKLHPHAKANKYIVEEVTNGDVVETIQSTGTLNPVTQVQVGAQVSGRILHRYVDFNSKVKKGDLLAVIDPLLFRAQVEADDAKLASAKANDIGNQVSVDVAKANLDRTIKLRDSGLANESDIVTAKGAYDGAVANKLGSEASLRVAVATLKSDQASLDYTKIYAPIDGVVISRSVDEGQTVASSFTAPVLFTIAQDLKQMLVLADVDEADLGRLAGAKDPDVEVRVEAFPLDTFAAKLQEIRYNSTTTQGVVTYPAVIDVDNPELKLRPGMTATVTIHTAVAHKTLRVPNAALRYHPSPPTRRDGKPEAVKPEAPLPKGKGRLYVSAGLTADTPPSPHLVSLGLTDGQFTQVIVDDDAISAGTKIVIDENDEAGGNDKMKTRGLF